MVLDGHSSKAEVLLDVFNDKNFNLKVVGNELKNDKEVVMCEARVDMWNFKYASERLQNDKAFVLDVLRINNWDVILAGADLKSVWDVMEIIKKLGCSHNFISSELQSDEDVAMAFICRIKRMLDFASKDLTMVNYTNMRLFMISNIQLKNLNNEMSNDDKEIVVQYIEICYELIRFVSFKLRVDPKMIVVALMRRPKIDVCIKFDPDIKLSYYSINDNIIWMRLA